MAIVEGIEQWRGEDVLDSAGEKLGKLDDLLYQHGASDPSLLRVKSGLLGRRSHLVPLAGASFSREHVRVAFAREQVEGADDEVSEGVLASEHAVRLSSLYGVEVPAGGYESGSLRETRSIEADRARERADELEGEAQERLGDVDQARDEAERAALRATQAEREGQSARDAAEQAREKADAAERSQRR